jgi:hypothetical protein
MIIRISWECLGETFWECCMFYQISCQCGDAVTVAETLAGTKIPCHCGRMISVPSLRELRRLTGSPQEEVPPEMEVETLLLANKLPEEDHCILCGTATDRFARCRTECERAQVKTDRWPWWVWLLVLLTCGALLAFGMIVVLAGTKGQTTEHGKDRTFDLPLRICDDCRQQLTNELEIKDAMWEVRAYRRLLEKYPGAKVTLLTT